MSGLESLLSEAHQKHRLSTEASYPSHLRIRERISGETWGLEIPSLELRRKFICLMQMYKIIFGHCDIDPGMFFLILLYYRKRVGTIISRQDLKKTRTNYFKFSVFNRYITDWNSIPSNIMHTSSLSSFKSYLSLDHLCQF